MLAVTKYALNAKVKNTSQKRFDVVILDLEKFLSINKPRKAYLHKINGLEVKVGFEVNVSILFGLEVSVKAIVHYFAEVLMENSFVLFTCVWCGVAFLRA
jgi:hypothetical protein